MRNPEFKKRNLCDNCSRSIPVCLSIRGINIKFGNGVGNDNVYLCNCWKPKRTPLSLDQLKRQMIISHPRFSHLSY